MSQRNLNVTIKIPKLFEDKLKNKRINYIYKNFEKSLNIDQNFIVGVSGGPDSLALAFLSKLYSIKKNLKSRFFIVDHKLRKESTKEAKSVKKILKKSYIDSEILTWIGKKPKNNVQSLARKKRFQLLFSKCKKLKINNILLAHHQDDLFENFFIRMLRGSGLKGLVSFDKKNKFDDINIFRPLLAYKKDDLIFISKYVFNFYVKDPSNKNTKFQRIRVRKLLSELEVEGLDKKKLINTINNLKNSDKVINYYVDENLKKNSLSIKKEKILLKSEFFIQPYEVVMRSLSDLIKYVGKNYYSVRGRKLKNIIEKIKKETFFKATLGGCIIKKVNKTILISKE